MVISRANGSAYSWSGTARDVSVSDEVREINQAISVTLHHLSRR